MGDFQESVTDRWTDTRQSDPYVCFAGDTINSDAENAEMFALGKFLFIFVQLGIYCKNPPPPHYTITWS